MGSSVIISMNEAYITLVGVIGAAFVLLAFVLNQRHVWRDTNIRYDFVNALGSFLLVVYAYLLGSVPFFILNGVWLAISVKDIIADVRP